MRLIRLFLSLATYCVCEGHAKALQHQVEIIYRNTHLGESLSEPIFCQTVDRLMIYQDGHDLNFLDKSGSTGRLFHSDGFVSPYSLSCSKDGTVIAALGDQFKSLYLYTDGLLSRYRIIPDHLSYTFTSPVIGLNPIMSKDGMALALPGQPIIADGPDILREKKIFVSPYQPMTWAANIPFFYANNFENVLTTNRDMTEVFTVYESRSKNRIIDIKSCQGSLFAVFLNDDSSREESSSMIIPIIDITKVNTDEFNSRAMPIDANEKILANSHDCIFISIIHDGSVHIRHDNKSIDLWGVDASIIRSASEMSEDGCFLASHIFEKGRNNFVIARNPIANPSCKN